MTGGGSWEGTPVNLGEPECREEGGQAPEGATWGVV